MDVYSYHGGEGRDPSPGKRPTASYQGRHPQLAIGSPTVTEEKSGGSYVMGEPQLSPWLFQFYMWDMIWMRVPPKCGKHP